MDGWGSAAIKYQRAHRAGIVWGDWLRHGRPKHTTCFRCALANPERIGDPGNTYSPFMAYGTDADNYTALLFEGAYEQQHANIQVQLLWFYARYQSTGGRKPLMIWPPKTEKAGQPIESVTDYCVRWQLTRARFFTRLNSALYDVELEMVERDREEPLAPVMTDAQRLKLRA